jgi:hypothetical protein
MSILLVNTDARVTGPLIELLTAHGDEVRVVEDGGGEAWQALGAKVARGSADDPDLIERAARGARTIVVMERRRKANEAALETAIEAGKLAGVGRIILCTRQRTDRAMDALNSSGLQYVVLHARGPGSFSRVVRSGTPVTKLAEAVDAADDLAGEPHLVLDLTEEEAWDVLRLEPR